MTIRRAVRLLLCSPLVVGAVLSAAWYGLILFGPLRHPTVTSLFTDHPVEYISTVLFFIGVGALLLRLAEIGREWRAVDEWCSHSPLEAFTPESAGQDESRSVIVTERLQGSRLARRLQELFRLAQAGADRVTLEGHLRHLAELDAAAVPAKSALVRMFIWAIPILGFLGTVIGIAMALGRLAPQQLEESLPEVMAALTVAFNTTILALGLCLLLYFALYFVERTEGKLLSQIDELVEKAAAKLQSAGANTPNRAPEGTFAPVPEMVTALLQAPLATWELAVREFVDSVRALGAELSGQLSQAVARTVEQSLSQHAQQLAALEEKLLARHQERLEESYRLFQRRLERAQEFERSVQERTETLLKALEAVEVLRTLQEALNRNLTILASSRQFEELVMSLTAAIHLLTARIEASISPSGAGELVSLQVQGMRKAG